MKRILLKTVRIFLYLLGFVLLSSVALLAVIRIYSSEKPEPAVDVHGNALPNSITLIKDTVINGAPQRLTIRGNDISNPILLRVHGGPGQAHAPQAYRFTGSDLEDLFTVCYWDQRGAGPAYTEEIPDSTITRNQIVKDGLAVCQYLRKRFGRAQIYIEGVSWGTVVSAYMIREKPDYFKAYIGIGQVTDQTANEILSYDFVMGKAVEHSDTNAINDLKRIGRPPYSTPELSAEAVQVERRYVNRYVPSKLEMGTMDMLKLILLYEGWSFGYKWKVCSEGMYGTATSLLWKENYRLDLTTEITDWAVPVYIIQGQHDHYTETSLVRNYLEQLKAPTKKLFIIEDAGHFVSAENSKRYREILMEILTLQP